MKDAVKALIRNNQGEILVLFRSHTHPSLAHDIDLPGGEVDSDETATDALAREVAEETGLEIDCSSVKYHHEWITDWGQRQMLYGAELLGDDKVEISWEHKSYTWMTVEDFVNYDAIDGFMHEAQDWLRGQASDFGAQSGNKAQHGRVAHAVV